MMKILAIPAWLDKPDLTPEEQAERAKFGMQPMSEKDIEQALLDEKLAQEARSKPVRVNDERLAELLLKKQALEQVKKMTLSEKKALLD